MTTIVLSVTAVLLSILVFTLSGMSETADGQSRQKAIEYQEDAYGNCFAIVSGNGHWVVAVPHCPPR